MLSSPALSEKPENMPLPLQPSPYLPYRHLALLSLMLLGGLTACGSPVSDNPPNLGQNTSMGEQPLSKQGSFPRNDAFPPSSRPSSLASVNGPGPALGMARVPRGDSPSEERVLASEPGHPVEGLVVPEAMAQKLNSPSVLVRLRALEDWAREAPPGAVDPFILAFEDKDERVRTRAQQLLEQDWARKAEAEKSIH
jgi:hypothetical protein